MSDFADKIIKKIFPDQHVKTSKNIAGGCINSAIQINTDQSTYFLKWNKQELHEMFQTEAQGLQLLNENSPVFSPKVIDKGVLDGKSYLLTEWIDKGSPSKNFWENFGSNLAKQHKKSNNRFGLNHDNYIGSLTQSNTKHTTWHEFFINERLYPQLQLAKSKGLVDSALLNEFDNLARKLDQLIPNEKPALLHGDLWSGNYMIAANGEAAIFDPAVHYGHRETELAFTRLFGGFSSDLYKYYEEEHPLEPGFEERVDIHNLYPLLVHVNLFGSSYLSGIIQTLQKYN